MIPAEPTRAAGLARLAAFTPCMGRLYATERNFDRGPDDRSHVSGLSPWIRHRLVGEWEAARAAVETHGAAASEKFVQEVFWRTYWKGWLEQRPGVWRDYLAGLEVQRRRLDSSSGLRDAHGRACLGQTGLACFDAWAQELAASGTLHNHTRMWFASIWIFTLRLPWELGADFFLRHLLDGDAASNTLSWRWVAGMQTRGKHYLARASNIARYTEGRFDPAGELDEDAAPLDAPEPPRAAPLPRADAPPSGRFALLLHEDDAGLDPPLAAAPAAIAGFAQPEARSPFGCSEAVARFAHGAVADSLRLAGERHSIAATALDPAQIADWAAAAGLREVVTPWAPVGWTATLLEGVARDLAARGITLRRIRRDWDEACWPHATRGFFAFREHIPELCGRLL
jgi:deoxyribodipyrimidine photo-lyase